MTRKGGQSMRAVQKSATKVQKPAVQKPGKKLSQVVFAKDTASFLKQRMTKKVRDLRMNATTSSEADADAMTDGCSVATAICSGAGSIEALQASALQRCDEYERDAENDEEDDEFAGFTNSCREAENTRRRFFVELRKVLGAADIIIEVLDARDPGACRCESLEREVLAAGKRLVLLVNKIDLVPKPAVEAWMKHLQRSFPTIAFKSAHGGGRVTHAMTSAQNAPEGLLRSTHAVVGADEVMQLLKNYSRMGQGGKSKAHVSVGIVGYPNVGKSSVINSMKRHGAVETGGRAGVTKIMQEVHLDSKVTLIDCPGVVFEGDSEDPDVVLRNVVRVENVADPVGVVEALLKKAPREAVQRFYNLQSDFGSVHDFLTHIAQVRGKLRRGSGLDIPSTARSIINDWTTGKFRYYAMPPVESSASAMAEVEAETAEVVTQLAPALDIDALLSGDVGSEKPEVLGAPRLQDGDAMDDGEGSGAVQVDI